MTNPPAAPASAAPPASNGTFALLATAAGFDPFMALILVVAFVALPVLLAPDLPRDDFGFADAERERVWDLRELLARFGAALCLV